ncbi:hypothetical protein GQ600_17703 [Phytophthora cactorum]|nr:hypothetical protein GQ600_17703 [Phytophthora cactorum]
MNSATCSQIWPAFWRGGANIPSGLNIIRFCAPSGAGFDVVDDAEGGLDDVSDCGDSSSVVSSSARNSNSAGKAGAK